MNVVAHLLDHPRWPLLVYPGVRSQNVTAEFFEDLFSRNGWPAAWRNGVHPFHHFHSNSHEALGVYRGEVTVQFGGDGGVIVTAKPGDVIVLPAGTGHKKLSSRGSLGVVGAYPVGSSPDTCTTPFESNTKNIAQVALPAGDPVYGARGPLFDHWR